MTHGAFDTLWFGQFICVCMLVFICEGPPMHMALYGIDPPLPLQLSDHSGIRFSSPTF